MKFKVATALIAATAALSLTGSASAWWFYVPPTSSQQQVNQAKTQDKAMEGFAGYVRG
jgi:hypothetical protein